MEEAAVIRKPKLRPGVDLLSTGKSIDRIEAPDEQLSQMYGFVITNHSIIVAVDELENMVYVFDSKQRSLVNKFPFTDDQAQPGYQITLDRHQNIIIPEGSGCRVHRCNINGKRLPRLPDHPGQSCEGVTCGPDGDIYVSSPYMKPQIFRLDYKTDHWSIFYQADTEGEGVNRDNELSTDKFTPGQLDFGPDGHLYVATSYCINVMDTTSERVVRQIEVEQHIDKVAGIFVSGDGLVFACDLGIGLHVFVAGSGAHVGDVLADCKEAITDSSCISVCVGWDGCLYFTEIDVGVIYVL